MSGTEDDLPTTTTSGTELQEQSTGRSAASGDGQSPEADRPPAPPSPECGCTFTDSSPPSPMTPHCVCPRDEHGIVIHVEECLLWKNERIIFPHELEGCECKDEPPQLDTGVCECCRCLPDQCHCILAGREKFDNWRKNRPLKAPMPAVLEAEHPLMQKFQDTLKRFLEKENEIAEEQILNMRYELKKSKEGYDHDLADIYRSDHATNAQRALILEYEETVAKRTLERQEADKRVKEAQEKYKKAQECLEVTLNTEREATQELEALDRLCRQLEEWRNETESELTVSQRISDKMRKEKKAAADEKRQIDVVILALQNEIWKLEYRMTMFQKQFEIKSGEMETVNDKVTAYAAELEDLELDKRRLVSLWNSVIGNIRQRDRIYNSVSQDYRDLQENYRTLLNNLDITKKVLTEEMNKGKEISMNRDKLTYDMNAIQKLYDVEDAKRAGIEARIGEYSEAIEMCERDQEMIKMENQAMQNILTHTEKEFDRKAATKFKYENEILKNLQECLLNDKAVESMADGIKKMREISRKQELGLMQMETNHSKVMLDIEVARNRKARNDKLLQETMEKVQEREKEIDNLEDQFERNVLVILRKQRELDLVNKQLQAFNDTGEELVSPVMRRIDELEQQIREVRERTETMQHEWLRLQGHVVKLASTHQRLVTDINLINKQISICDQKNMRIQADCDAVNADKARVDRSLRDLRGQLELLQRTRKDATDRNHSQHHATAALTQEYSANLKNAEDEIIRLEDEIQAFENQKSDLTQELDRVQREALIWQRKGILAVELKRSVHEAKSAQGDIGQMKSEIHRMEVRRSQLYRISERLADDLAHCVTMREVAMDKARSNAAVEKLHGSHGTTTHSQYHHKIRLARSDVARVTKDVQDSQKRIAELEKDQKRLTREVEESLKVNAKLEEKIAEFLGYVREGEKEKAWLLERVVRMQRLGSELTTAVKRQTLRVRKPKATVLQEFDTSRALNDRMVYIVDTLIKEYPYLKDKLDMVANTLNIHSPTQSPRLLEPEWECWEQPPPPPPVLPEKPYCPHE